MNPLMIRAFTLTNALGRGVEASRQALEGRHSGLVLGEFESTIRDTWFGRVAGVESEPVPEDLETFDCRNNRLAHIGLSQDGFVEQVERARRRHGAERIGVFLGTSTSGSLELEKAYQERNPTSETLPANFRYDSTFDTMSLAAFVRQRLSLTGPAAVITTACSSSAKVFACAYRHLSVGTCDAAVVGGVDSLCLSTLHGFRSLGLVSDEVCRPFDAHRRGLNIGEGAGFALLEPASTQDRGIGLIGYGESSDAYHMAAPHPQGHGAVQAMRQALTNARIAPESIDYINLHGTGTKANDKAEDRAVGTVFGSQTPCSATKGWTGHTLGAAGITEAIFSFISLANGFLPGTLNTQQVDPTLCAKILKENQERPVRAVLTNSFGFGGSNCTLLFGKL